MKSHSATFDPTGLPSAAPMAITGKSRSPVSGPWRSFAYDQKSAMLATLKIPTHTKNANPRCGTRTSEPT